MKNYFTNLLLTALLMIAFFSSGKSGTSNQITLLMIAFFFCRNSSASNKNQNNKSGALDGIYASTALGGANGDIIKFEVGSDAITNTIPPSFSSAFVYSFGEVIFTGIPSAIASTNYFGGYRYGPGWQTVNTGNVVLTLKNGNAKFIVDYPGTSEGVLWTGGSFPEINYVYKKQ